jgi:hypothetical protein
MWWDIAKELINFAYKKQINDIEKKEKISKACDRISKLLTDTVKELKSDVYPVGKCAAMDMLSEELIFCFKGYMEEDKLNHLSDMLHYSSKLEKEYATRKSNDTIDTLIKTAGQFDALSIIYSI